MTSIAQPFPELLANKLAVIADDLTGACDSACQFALYGFLPEVVHSAGCSERQAQFVVCNSESRKDDSGAAQQKIFHIASALLRAHYQPFYKKLDSTLKGPWCAELAGMAKAVQPEIVVVAPAFPAWGRTTVEGIQCVQGRPVWESRFHALPHGDGPPAAEPGDLLHAMQSQFGKRVRHVRRASLKRGAAALAKEMDAARFQGFPFQVFDAEVDEDLKTIALAGCRLERRILWVGSGGLARCLPPAWGLRTQQRDCYLSCPQTMAINGSFNPANKEQLGCLEQEGTTVYWIEDEDADDGTRCRRKVESLLGLLDHGRDVALSVRLNKPIRSASQLQRLQDALQFAATRCLAAPDKIGLILIGGDTAIKLYRNLGADAIRIEGEVQPGVPHGRWVGGRLDGQPVVTKAGGFGQADTLIRAAAFLKGT
ncbi:MAG TPA: four-carbon acid sugar kinase family protein [Nitrospira sp.]|nr:four-carbon acid sugar kinase family protein [Nitrospira sp.]